MKIRTTAVAIFAAAAISVPAAARDGQAEAVAPEI